MVNYIDHLFESYLPSKKRREIKICRKSCIPFSDLLSHYVTS